MLQIRRSAAVALLSGLLVLQLPIASNAGARLGASHHGVAGTTARRPAIAHGPRTKAKMYAWVIRGYAGPKIQVHNQLCRDADPTRSCVATTARLQQALEARTSRFGVTITWVDAAVPDSTNFWVFAPIRVHQREARFKFHFEETFASGCISDGNSVWRWTAGAWHPTGGGFSTGCP